MPEYPTSINRQTIISFPLNDNRDDITTGIEAGSLYLNKILFEKQLNFGECHSDRFEVTLFDCDDITGETIQVYQLDYSEDEENPVRTDLFHGVVDSCTREDNGVNRKIVAYDLMYTIGNLDATDWWNTFWSDRISATIYEIFNSLVTTFNIQLFPVSDPIEDMPNMQLEITQFSGVQAITVGTVLAYIGQICMFNPHFTATGAGRLLLICYAYGLFEGIAPQNIEGMYEDENSHFEEYVTEPVTRVVIYGETDVIAGEYGTGDNVYVFKNNPLLYNLTNTTYDAVAQTIYETLSAIEMTTGYTGICYKPAEIKMIVAKNGVSGTFGLGGLVQTPQGISIISSIEMSGTMFIEQTIRSVGNQKLTPDDFNLTDSKIGKVTEQATTTAKHFVWVPNDGAYVTTDNVAAGQAPTNNYSKLTDTGLYVATDGKEVAHFGIDENNEPVSVLGSTETGNTSVIMSSEGILAGKQVTDLAKIDYFNVRVPDDTELYTHFNSLNLVVSGNSGYLDLNTSEVFLSAAQVYYSISYRITGSSQYSMDKCFFVELSHSRGGYDVIIEDLLDILFEGLELPNVSVVDRYNAPLRDWFDAWFNDGRRSAKDLPTRIVDVKTGMSIQVYSTSRNTYYNDPNATHVLVYAHDVSAEQRYLKPEDYSFSTSNPSRIDIVNTHFLDYTTPLPTAPRSIQTHCGNNIASLDITRNIIAWRAAMLQGDVAYQMTMGKSVENNQGLNSIVLGDNNSVTDDSQLGVFIAGSNNSVDNNRVSDTRTGVFVIGNDNEVNQHESVVIGRNNDLSATSTAEEDGYRNTVVGNDNSITINSQLGTGNNAIFGNNNDVDGLSNVVIGTNNVLTGGPENIMLGSNLITSETDPIYTTVLGRYNASATHAQFVIGNGNTNGRHNAVEITSGEVKINNAVLNDGADVNKSLTLYPTQSNALIFNNGGVDRTLYIRYQNDAGGTNVPIIAVKPTGTNSGAIMGIGASGLTVVGGGESIYTIAGDPSKIGLSTTSENAVVCSDGAINFISNANDIAQTTANFKIMSFQTSGILKINACNGTGNQLSYFDSTGQLQRSNIVYNTSNIQLDSNTTTYYRAENSTAKGAVQIESDASGSSGLVCKNTSGVWQVGVKLDGSAKRWYGEAVVQNPTSNSWTDNLAAGNHSHTVSFNKGVWFVQYYCFFPSNATGNKRQVGFTNSSSGTGYEVRRCITQRPVSGTQTCLQGSTVINVTADTENWYLKVSHDATSTLNGVITGYIATRLRL